MLKAAGILLLLLGTTGFSRSICNDQKNRLRLLKEMKYMYQMIQNEILYTGLPLPEIFRSISEKAEPPFKEALMRISRGMNRESGESFAQVWEREMKEILTEIPFSPAQKKLLYQFPESCGLSDQEGQARVIERYLREMDRWIIQMEKEEKSKNKVIMSLGIATGIFLSILLL